MEGSEGWQGGHGWDAGVPAIPLPIFDGVPSNPHHRWGGGPPRMDQAGRWDDRGRGWVGGGIRGGGGKGNKITGGGETKEKPE